MVKLVPRLTTFRVFYFCLHKSLRAYFSKHFMISFVYKFSLFPLFKFIPFLFIFYSLVKWDFRFTWLLTCHFLFFFVTEWVRFLRLLSLSCGIIPPLKISCSPEWPHRGCRIVWIRVNFVWLLKLHRSIVLQVWFAGGEFWEFDIQTGVPMKDPLFHCTSSLFCQRIFLIRLVYNCITDTM